MGYNIFSRGETIHMRHLFDFIDPMRKGPLFHRYGWKGILFIMVATALCYAWFKGPHHCPLAGIFWFFTIGIHEAGHPIFRFLSGGNFMWSIWGGTLTEVGVPLLAYFCFLRQGKEIQADGCLFLLAVAFYSVGHYTGVQFGPGNHPIKRGAGNAAGLGLYAQMAGNRGVRIPNAPRVLPVERVYHGTGHLFICHALLGVEQPRQAQF